MSTLAAEPLSTKPVPADAMLLTRSKPPAAPPREDTHTRPSTPDGAMCIRVCVCVCNYLNIM